MGNGWAWSIVKGASSCAPGPNSAGKTTTIKIVVGILCPDAGTVMVDGLPAVPSTPEVRRRIGYVPDTPELWPRLRGIEYLAFLADVYRIPSEERAERAWPLVEALELVEAIEDPIASYSHGMRQKLALVGALMVRPALLVLDEVAGAVLALLGAAGIEPLKGHPRRPR